MHEEHVIVKKYKAFAQFLYTKQVKFDWVGTERWKVLLRDVIVVPDNAQLFMLGIEPSRKMPFGNKEKLVLIKLFNLSLIPIKYGSI